MDHDLVGIDRKVSQVHFHTVSGALDEGHSPAVLPAADVGQCADVDAVYVSLLWATSIWTHY